MRIALSLPCPRAESPSVHGPLRHSQPPSTLQPTTQAAGGVCPEDHTAGAAEAREPSGEGRGRRLSGAAAVSCRCRLASWCLLLLRCWFPLALLFVLSHFARSRQLYRCRRKDEESADAAAALSREGRS